MKPSFLGIGAQRCGTTWAHRTLAKHPEIFVSQPKELRYFTANYDKGIAWYTGHFENIGNAKVVGEITPGYIYRDVALQRIARDLPDIKLFAILRNPIDRAYSAYRFFCRRDYVGMTFAEALEKDNSLLAQGRYADSIDRLWSLFPRERCLIIIYDDLKSTPERTARRLYGFLDVDPEFSPPGLKERINRPIFPKTQDFLMKIRLDGAIDLIKKSPLGPRIRAWPASSDQQPKITEAERKALSDYFEEDIRETGRKLGTNLQHWLA